MYADRARDLIVSAGFIGSLERREALVNLLGRNKLPTASRSRFAGDPYLWEGASEINLSEEEVAFLFCLGQRGEKRPHGEAEVRIVWCGCYGVFGLCSVRGDRRREVQGNAQWRTQRWSCCVPASMRLSAPKELDRQS